MPTSSILLPLETQEMNQKSEISSPQGATKYDFDWVATNQELEQTTAQERIAWALEHFSSHLVLSSSFGAQAAVSLHLATIQKPDIPVVLIDTGYLFPETYQFIDELVERLHLNLHIYRPRLSSAWQEARWGKLWEQGLEGIQRYNQINKVKPMERALQDFGAQAWMAGLRRKQATSRQQLRVLEIQKERLKIHPIIDWSDKDIFDYLQKNQLPYHPLWHQGYVSIGDTHTTRRLTEGMNEEDTRFFGLTRECGLHQPTSSK